MRATIYLVTNTVNGHTYVGVTRFTPERRWQAHRSVASRKPITYLHRAIAKYGPEAFTVESIATVVSVNDGSHVERDVIVRLAPAYNQTNGGEFTVGKAHSPETVAKRAASNRGLRRTPSQNAANSAQAKARHARDPKYTEMARAALAKGRANCDHVKRIAAVKEHHKTYKWSDESRAKLSAACICRVHSPDVIARISASNKKPVICTTLGLTFPSCEAAAEHLGIARAGIYKVCGGKHKRFNGLVFQYGAK
jgi:group I intron endonuclease